MGFKTWLIGTMSFIASAAQAGWNSGGGLSKLANNPWFLNANTTTVQYCIRIANDFPYEAAELDHMIQAGVKYWKGEFAKAWPSPHNPLMVGGQTFIHNCAAKDAITFQFGYLTAEQKKEIPEYRSFLSLAVRTDYDLKTLRSKGFIYFAPETGPDKPDVDYIIDKPWSAFEGYILHSAIFHELGHMFGFAHYGEIGQLMHEYHLERLATPGVLPADIKPENPAPVALRDIGFSTTECSFFERTFWEAPLGEGCLHIVETDFDKPLTVWWSATKNSEKKKLGTIKHLTSQFMQDVEVRLRLPKEQEVMEAQGQSLRYAFSAPAERESLGVYRPSAHPNLSKGVLLTLRASHSLVQIHGPVQNIPMKVYQGGLKIP